MSLTYIKLIETAVVVVAYLLFKYVAILFVDRTLRNKFIQKARGKIIKKAINFSLLFICTAFILAIWGVNQKDLAIYIGSILTVVGVAFFAQWSIISNITSSIIIFFNHNVKLDDTIVILEAKEYEIEGRVSDIGLFFIILKTQDGEELTLPNNVFLQKMIRKKNNPTPAPPPVINP